MNQTNNQTDSQSGNQSDRTDDQTNDQTSQVFTITAPDGQFINTASSEKEAFKLLGAKNKKDRQILIKAGFKVTEAPEVPAGRFDLSEEDLESLPVFPEKSLTSADDQVV